MIALSSTIPQLDCPKGAKRSSTFSSTSARRPSVAICLSCPAASITVTHTKSVVIDLFAGAGGLSLGAARAGFQVAGAVEIDKHALETHQRNFPETRHLTSDVSKLSGAELLTSCGLQAGELTGLIGGPPCQGFSSIGKGDPLDPRNELFGHFMRLVDETRPAFFVAENVPGILHQKNDEARNAALKLLPKGYVLLAPFKAEAFKFGAPTIRTRLFFIGFDPQRVTGLDATALEGAHVPHRTNVKSALSGLPSRISPDWLEESDGWRAVKELNGDYFGKRAQGKIPPGIGNSESLRLFRQKKLVSGNLGTRHTQTVVERFEKLRHGQMDATSKCTRLDPQGYCPTLRAGTGSDKGSFQSVRPVHPSVSRVITPREAARLQGFPDWFLLHPTKWHSFRQIGNSVSPLVAEAVLQKIKDHLIS